MPDDLHDRARLLAAHWHTNLWFVFNLALRIGLDQLEEYLLAHPDFLPESAPDIGEAQRAKVAKRGRTGHRTKTHIKFKVGDYFYV